MSSNENTINAPELPKLREFGKDLWVVEGPRVRDMGILFTTRMTIARLKNGALWVSSPVTVPFKTLQMLDELGPVKYLIAGTPRHVWRLDSWHSLFPQAELWSTHRTLFTLKKSDLPFTGILGDQPEADWADDLDQMEFLGSPSLGEIMFLHKKSRTLILDDIIQVHTPEPGKLLKNLFMKLEGITAPQGGVAVDIRLSFTRRQAAHQSLEKLLSWDFDRLIMAHGPCLEKDAKSFVAHAFRWLSGKTGKKRM